MNDEKENSNPIAGIYGLGIIGYTAVLYSQDGFWMALGKSLIWPINLGVFLIDKFK